MLQDAETALFTKARGIARLPNRLHPPCRAGTKCHHGARARFLLVEPAEW
jgi:hypothetical protein